jgi:hypothetical protein
MGNIVRITVKWTGLQGGNGFSNFYFEPVPQDAAITQTHVNNAAGKVEAFLVALRPYRPSYSFTEIDPQVTEIDENSGDYRAFWGVNVAAPAGGTSAVGAHSAAAGACVNWTTANIVNNRRVRGRTFLVPVGSAGLDTNGTLGAQFLTDMRAAATTLQADGTDVRLVVWRRPTILGIDGGAYDVIAGSINDKTAILTSRRD